MILSHEQARSFYDRFGRKQDLQRVYEDPAVERLLAHAAFEDARNVLELGCGTGRLAERLLRARLPPHARYLGLDVSGTIVELARGRLQPWADRAEVRLTDGSFQLPVADHSYDRFLATYVLDLLGEDDIGAALAEAQRVLVPGATLCLASLTFGQGVASRAVCRLWSAIHAVRPMWVGGCRPLDLRAHLDDWRVLHHEVVCTLAICTEVVVAS